MPKYAADPSESKVIEVYDQIMNRFQGHYGRQPDFFIRSPAAISIFGDNRPYIAGNVHENPIFYEDHINQISIASSQ